MKRLFSILILLSICCVASAAKNSIVENFKPTCDSLALLVHERCGVQGKLELKTVMKRKGSLDFYFTESLGDFPWYKEDIKWLRKTLKDLFPEDYRKYRLGEIYSRRVNIELLAMPHLSYDGKPVTSRHKAQSPPAAKSIVSRIGDKGFTKGLSGRHIALWQSHGKYYNCSSETWCWQRPCLFQTCEDMFTQGFVLPFLVPMLENAGAYVLLPRERDIQRNEIIADNDSISVCRGSYTYCESGKWDDAGTGFADTKEIYEDLENPFTMGSAKMTQCAGASPSASAKWTPAIPQRGEYAVYVSYKSLPESSSSAHYTVRHLGGESEFAVDQRMGGGTWIYLGTFEFEEGNGGCVILDNATPKGYKADRSRVITADAVRFGGGMGNIARNCRISPEDSTATVMEPTVSGLPRFAEGARYWLQWAGADSSVYYLNEGRNDYKDDFMSRGDWVEWISRGSRVNPDKCGGLGIPVDLSLGFHTDAGITPDDSLVGTLAIYTYKSEGKTTLPSGEDRLTSRMYADMVQSQIVSDLRKSYDSLWTRRSLWDRAYRESRTPSCPAMLLELLSHQNFADMKYGLDPSFRFDVSRSVYKGMLKYLSSRYGCEYSVQPLPVSHICASFGRNGKAVISWKPTEDPLEPTAVPDGYILYSRQGDGGYDKGVILQDVKESDGLYQTEVPVNPGEIKSFRIAAFNEGGISFPSETVSIGIPHSGMQCNPVLIVNNFDRISGPSYFDYPEFAGFDNSLDGGVPYMRDITHVGQMHNSRRAENFVSNARPGFGASYTDMAGKEIAGNTFDYASIHGKAVMDAGYPFYSCSNERFCSDTLVSMPAWTVDLICGKQVTVRVGKKQKYTIFDENIQRAVRKFCSRGGNMIVSGAYIGTDFSDSIYPIQKDSLSSAQTGIFASEVLGYRYVTSRAARNGKVIPVSNKALTGHGKLRFTTEANSLKYCVESPDGIAPSSADGHTIYRYEESGIPAGIFHQGDGYRTACLGFPIEALEDYGQIHDTIGIILEHFSK